MNPNLVPVSAPEVFSASLPEQASGHHSTTGADSAAGAVSGPKPGCLSPGTLTSRQLHPWRSAYIAFFATVFACMAAAAAVAGHDLPLLLGGF